METARFLDCPFAGELGSAVYAERASQIRFVVGRSFAAVKYIVRRVMNQQSPAALSLFGEDLYASCIYRCCPCRLCFRLVDRGVTGGVNDDVGLEASHDT